MAVTNSSSTLAQRIKAEFEGHQSRAKETEAGRTKEANARDERMAKFDKACNELREVWRPQLEEFAKQFGDSLKLTPTVTPSQREAKATFLTDLANITLTLSVTPSPDVTKLVLDYDLLILPMYFQYERHSRLELPLDAIDKNAVAKWLEDRLVSCVQAYLSIQENEFYLKRAMVEDPVTKTKFLRNEAAATLEHKGQMHYFSSKESLEQFKKKLQITA